DEKFSSSFKKRSDSNKSKKKRIENGICHFVFTASLYVLSADRGDAATSTI
ncbi:unnamed protein product, partial [marine sediment metagenome]